MGTERGERVIVLAKAFCTTLLTVQFLAVERRHASQSEARDRLTTTEEVAAQLVSAFILSRLDYCNSVIAGLPRCTT